MLLVNKNLCRIQQQWVVKKVQNVGTDGDDIQIQANGYARQDDNNGEVTNAKEGVLVRLKFKSKKLSETKVKES